MFVGAGVAAGSGVSVDIGGGVGVSFGATVGVGEAGTGVAVLTIVEVGGGVCVGGTGVAVSVAVAVGEGTGVAVGAENCCAMYRPRPFGRLTTKSVPPAAARQRIPVVATMARAVQVMPNVRFDSMSFSFSLRRFRRRAIIAQANLEGNSAEVSMPRGGFTRQASQRGLLFDLTGGIAYVYQ